MEVCSNGHDEICLEAVGYNSCPVCELVAKIEDLEDQLKDLASGLDELRKGGQP